MGCFWLTAPRWTTLGPCCAWLALACAVHSLLPRAWSAAFAGEGAEADVGVDDAGQADWKRIMGARILKGTTLVANPESVRHAIYVAVISEPLDAFVRAFLEVDVQGQTVAQTILRRFSAAVKLPFPRRFALPP